MEYVEFNRAGRALVVELQALSLQNVVNDFTNNLDKLATHMAKNIGKDIHHTVNEFKHTPLEQEHPYCWMVWMARGCLFMRVAQSNNKNFNLKTSTAIRKAYSETLKKHHSMLAAGVSISAFTFLEKTIDSSLVDWDAVKRHVDTILSICDKHGIDYN